MELSRRDARIMHRIAGGRLRLSSPDGYVIDSEMGACHSDVVTRLIRGGLASTYEKSAWPRPLVPTDAGRQWLAEHEAS